MAKRFIKLYEQITKWEWYRNGNTCRLFIHLLLKANFKETRFEGITIHRGEVVTSLPRLMLETGMTEREIRTAIGHLVQTGEVTNRSTRQYRVITILKYDEYQKAADETPDETPDERQADDSRMTGEGQTADGQATDDRQHHKKNKERNITSTEGREGKEARAEAFTPPTVHEVRDYVNFHNLQMTSSDFIDYYESNGWMVGNTPMRDWKAAARTWARRQKERRKPALLPAQDYHQRDYSGEDELAMERMLEHARKLAEEKQQEAYINKMMERDDEYA